jgi:hypothetical protein
VNSDRMVLVTVSNFQVLLQALPEIENGKIARDQRDAKGRGWRHFLASMNIASTTITTMTQGRIVIPIRASAEYWAIKY